MAPTVAAGGASIVLTHSLAEPRRQYLRPQYDDVVEEVRDYLASRLEQAVVAGVARDRLVLHHGPDLNKYNVKSLAMMRDWEEITSLGNKVQVALSVQD